jgi:hypothetical protein
MRKVRGKMERRIRRKLEQEITDIHFVLKSLSYEL